MKVGLVQSMLRGAFASVLFALFAVSVSENAAAQTVQTCQVNLNVLLSNPIGQDPHFPTDPEILEWFELCEGESFNSGNVFNTNYNTDRCAACDFTCPFSSNVLYEVEGSSVDYCGPRSQCNAVGGAIIDSAGNPTGEVCGCDGGNARIGGICVEGQDEADCTEFQEYASSEDEDRTEGACRPRVKEDCPDNTAFTAESANPADGGTCAPCGGHQTSTNGDACAECPVDTFRGTGASCVACPIANEGRAREETRCSCPNTHYDHPTEERCDPIPDCTDAHHRLVNNVCTECDRDQHLVNGSCVACDTNEVRAQGADNCSCPFYDNMETGTCDLIPDCPDAHHRPVNNVCTECGANQHLVNGSCVACDANEVRAQGAAECLCRSDYYTGGGSCTAFLECTNNLTLNREDNTCFCNSATHFEETGGSCVLHTDCTGEGANVIRNTETNACVCANNYEGEPGSCSACESGKESRNGAACECPDNLPFDRAGVCEASVEENCAEHLTYMSETNTCDCPAGQRLNADETACEAIPASSDGGSSNGAAVALIAVPVVLIAGYWWLGGFDYLNPTYNLDYSGENSDFTYQGDAGFSLNHRNLNSYARAIQSKGDAVSYESGISYETDNFSLTYAATESQSDYDFFWGAELGYSIGAMDIAPTAAASLQYQDGEDWDADATAGLTANWTAHRWIVRAQSDFSEGDGAYSFSVVRSF